MPMHCCPAGCTRAAVPEETLVRSSHAVPLVDLRSIDQAATLRRLDQACREWGLFRLAGHRIPALLIARQHAAMSAFCAKPPAAKRAIERSAHDPCG